jgi:uncharacterized protein
LAVSQSEFIVPAFKPLLASGWGQTIAAVYWPQRPELRPTALYTVSLPDGDQLAIVENRPREWHPGKRIAVLVHGLVGSSASKDLVRLSRKLVGLGFLTIRVNLRGCGPGFGLARHLYHSGRSEDTRAVIRWLAARYPDSPVTQIGISLGGNITLKMAGEDGAHPAGRLDSVVAVSAPIDLAACADRLAQPKNRFFDRYFVGLLLRHTARLHQRFPDLPRIEFPKCMTLRLFDDIYTAPRSGFRDAADYYARSSSEQFIPHIACPALIVCAADDPIVDAQCYRRLSASDFAQAGQPFQAGSNLQVVMPQHGGHVGFLARPGWGGIRWVDNLILGWLQRL